MEQETEVAGNSSSKGSIVDQSGGTTINGKVSKGTKVQPPP